MVRSPGRDKEAKVLGSSSLDLGEFAMIPEMQKLYEGVFGSFAMPDLEKRLFDMHPEDCFAGLTAATMQVSPLFLFCYYIFSIHLSFAIVNLGSIPGACLSVSSHPPN